MKNLSIGFGLALILSSYAAEVRGQSITNLGTLPDAADSYAFGVSADGLVVAGNSGLRPFRWSAATGMQLLPVLAPLGFGESAAGAALSADGSVIVGNSGARPVRWTSSGVSDLGSTGAPGGAFAADVSSNGGTVVGYSGTSSFVWRQGSGMQQIASDSQATAISADGLTIAGYLHSSNSAFRWRPPGSLESSVAGGGVEDLSDDGSVMVGWVQTEFGQRGYRWTVSSGIQILPTLAGASSASAQAVSGDGSVVIGSCQVGSANHGFIWSQSRGVESLYERLANLKVDLTGWSQLSSATSISADGRIVCGYGVFNGQQRAFVADVSDRPPCAISDLTANGVVDGADLGALLAFWGPVNPVLPQADIDGNGIVDGADLGTLLAHWGPCGAPAWATVIEWQPDPSVVTDPVLRAAIQATGLPWRVRDMATQIEMLLVPPGTFQMGCIMGSDQLGCFKYELPVHQVTLTSAFYLGRFEVTQAQWVARLGSNPSYFVAINGFPDSDTRPVEQVTWNSIQGYLAATGFRLPTEAEWEFACRAGTQTPFHSGPGFPNGTTDDSLVSQIACVDCRSTQPVGGKAANAFGFHEMPGNVQELVNDFFDSYPGGASTNPTGPNSGPFRTIRGGAWSYGTFVRSSLRYFQPPDVPDWRIGFRVARNP